MEVAEIIESADILEYISQYTELEQRSDGEFWGLSPLREENTPSFSVNTEIQKFYDFSSGTGGNIIDFIRAYHGCDFHKALAMLKKFANIEEGGEEIQCTKLQATSVAKKYKPAKQKQVESKSVVLPADYMNRYEWNLEKMKPWIEEGISESALEKYRVRYDPFSERIVYPILDMQGNIINVSGRTIDPQYKEKGLRKYTYFKPLGLLDTIYGFAENKEAILKKKEIILFEGAKSVMLAESWGVDNAGAILTSHLNPQQFLLLIRMGVSVVFALDAEVDITKDKNIKRLLPYVPVYWLCNRRNLLEAKDAPVDKGEEVFRTLYAERKRMK